MAQITITINSREYAVACDDGQERYMFQLARILDEKAKQLTAGGGQINENMLLAMVGLLVADELTEAKKQLESPHTNTTPTEKNDFSEKPQVDFKQTDKALAETLNQFTTQIKMLANEIESM